MLRYLLHITSLHNFLCSLTVINNFYFEIAQIKICMRVVCISDTHGHHRKLDMPAGDILIHAGDITRFSNVPQIEDFNNWLTELPYKHKIIIAGNHENPFKDMKKKLSNGTYLDNSSVVVDDIKIYGVGYFAEEFYGTIPANTDIVISHNPPFNIGDHSPTGTGGCGSKNLLLQIHQKKPKLHIFGHVHSGHGIYDNVEGFNTTFVNAAICGGQYDHALTHAPTVMEI